MRQELILTSLNTLDVTLFQSGQKAHAKISALQYSVSKTLQITAGTRPCSTSDRKPIAVLFRPGAETMIFMTVSE